MPNVPNGTLPRFVFVTFVTSIAAALSLAVTGCSDPPRPKTPKDEEGVPANSLSEARLGKKAPKEEDESDEEEDDESSDPTQPYMTKVGEPPPDVGTPSKDSGSSSSKDAMTKAECERVMDRYLELEIASNPRLKDVPPEVVAQAKQMARQRHGEAPCSGTKAQYKCAMAATSTSAWQRCMK